MSSQPTDSDTSSLYTLTDSIRPELYRKQGERRTQATTADYLWPCDSAAVRLEFLCADIGNRFCNTGVCWDPRVGEVDRVLSSPSDGRDPPRVIDLGSGATASWIISMAERYPHVECIGVDLIPSDLTFLPPNLSIEVHDLQEGLPFPDEFFSLVHARATVPTSIFDSSHGLLAEISRVLRPGGILFLEEIDETFYRSRFPNDTRLALVNARHAFRLDKIAASMPEYQHRMTWGSRMADECRKMEGFRAEEDGGYVEERLIEVSLGHREGDGPPATQLGTLFRQLWLEVNELQSVAIGMDEAAIQSARKMDEVALPEEDVGLYSILREVWAVKGGRRREKSSAGDPVCV